LGGVDFETGNDTIYRCLLDGMAAFRKPSFEKIANVWFEPILTDAAPPPKVRYS